MFLRRAYNLPRIFLIGNGWTTVMATYKVRNLLTRLELGRCQLLVVSNHYWYGDQCEQSSNVDDHCIRPRRIMMFKAWHKKCALLISN
jgi:hypothetical protein